MSADHSAITCGHEGCGATVWMDPHDYDRRKRTHETWFCPNGHERHFVGKTAEEKKIEALQARVDMLERVERSLIRQRDLEARRCPWTGCFRSFANSQARHTHMVRAHGMPTLAVWRAEEAS